MQDASVRKLFQEQINYYSKPDLGTESLIIPLAIQWIKSKKFQRKIEICEFGGGAGQLLNEIQKNYPNTSCTNVEIIDDYKSFLVSKKIKYIKGSVLNSGFADESFDILIIRDVLHHLIGGSYKETKKNQQDALRELKRLLRPGGAIFIEELANQSEIATRLIYYFSKLNSTFISFASIFNVNRNTIVAFFNPKRLEQLCRDVFRKEKITVKKYDNPKKSFKFSQLLHFGAKGSKMVIVVEKTNHKT